MKTSLKNTIPVVALALLTASTSWAQAPTGPRPPRPQPPVLARRPPAPPAPAPVRPGPPQFGLPLEGLTAAELVLFNDGRGEFLNVENAASGLGPIFNNASCVSCHGRPTVGGSSAIRVTRFGRTVDNLFDPLADLGGSLLQRLAINPNVREVVPHEANVVALRQSTPVFGLGLIEAIPDATIQALADAPEVDGVKGHTALVSDPATGETYVGRFGWKSQHYSLLAFSGDAYLNEMGITNRLFPKENAPNGNSAILAQYDKVADPEDRVDPVSGKGDIDVVADFMRLLAPPPSQPLSGAATAGRTLFQQIGCANCHTPTLTTGPNPVAALSNKTVPLYSDLLLHDMGSLGDGIVQGNAGPTEMRTAPLWGLRVSGPYLHDGRAPSVSAAILQHEGQGANSRDRYKSLTARERQQLLAFLQTL